MDCIQITTAWENVPHSAKEILILKISGESTTL